MKKQYYALIAILIIGILLAIFSASTASQSPTKSPPYFSQNASVMYFYSHTCHWCQEQKTVLTELGEEGYKVKPMNVGNHPGYWDEYSVTGTPTFIAPNGDRLTGFQEKEVLKSFLDQHSKHSGT